MAIKSKKNYAWAEDILLKLEGIDKVNAQTVGEELELIEKQEGKITPDIVVDWAEKNTESALNECFSWDVDEEARRWRLLKARKIVGRIRIYFIKTPSNDPDITHYAYQSLSVDSQRQYFNIDVVMNDSELRRKAVRQALLGLRQWVNRNNHLRAQLDIMESIESTLKKSGLL